MTDPEVSAALDAALKRINGHIERTRKVLSEVGGNLPKNQIQASQRVLGKLVMVSEMLGNFKNQSPENQEEEEVLAELLQDEQRMNEQMQSFFA